MAAQVSSIRLANQFSWINISLVDFALLHRWFGRPNTRHRQRTPKPDEPAAAEAQFLKGAEFANGQGNLQDEEQAAYWYSLAAEQNHGLAQFKLGTMYGQGQGVVRDDKQAMVWMTKAAHLGNPDAQYWLGVKQHVVSRMGDASALPGARIEALMWVRLAAKQGYHGAEAACEFVALGMTREEVAESDRRTAAFVTG